MSSVVRPDHAGRGSGAHALVDQANHFYRTRGLALIERVEPPAIRTREGIIAGRGNVDYRGGARLPGIPCAVTFAFDLKATTTNTLDLDPGHVSPKELLTAYREGRRPRVKAKVPQHQVEFLTDAERCGWLAFWLVQFTKHRRHFVLPHRVLVEHYKEPYRIGLSVFEERAIEVGPNGLNPLDYLSALPHLLATG